jgi:hypothetical protein
MKKIFFVLLLVLISNSFPQNNNLFKISVRAVSPDKAQEINLQKKCLSNETMDGYIYTSNQEKILCGDLVPYGFNFLDSAVWCETLPINKNSQFFVDMGDLNFFTNGIDVGEVLSFQLQPVILPEKDTLLLYIKYQVIKLLKIQGKEGWDVDNNYNIKLYYKVRKIPYDKWNSLNIIQEHYNNMDIEIKVARDSLLPLKPENEFIVKEIEKSCNESKFNSNIELGAEFAKTDTVYFGSIPFMTMRRDFLYRNLFKADAGHNSILYGDKVIRLNSKVYYINFNVPFELYLKADREKFAGYKTKDKILRSNYNIYFIPIKMANDTLTADIIADYKKLNIDDKDIPRWTPFKKRISVKLSEKLISLIMPNENWTVNMEREGEKYSIFGFSQYEKYVKEILLFNIKNGNKEQK